MTVSWVKFYVFYSYFPLFVSLHLIPDCYPGKCVIVLPVLYRLYDYFSERRPERGPERGPERSHERGPERGPESDSERSPERGPESGSKRANEMGPVRDPEWGHERGPGYHHGTFLEFFTHVYVFHRLFTIVCFTTLVLGCYPRKFVRIILVFCDIFGYWTRKTSGIVSSAFFHNPSFNLVY